MSTIIDLTNQEEKEYVYIKVDELDDKPKIIRKVSATKPKKIISLCDNRNCNKTDEYQVLGFCTGCFNNRYCSIKCQKEDWNFHKSTCKSM